MGSGCYAKLQANNIGFYNKYNIPLMSHSKRILWFTVLIINIIIVHEIVRKLILTELILLNTNSNYKVNY